MTIETSKYPATKYPDVKPADAKPSDGKNDLPRSKNAAEIEAAIAETRTALSDDVKVLSDVVTPANIKHEVKQVAKQAKDAVYETAVDAVVELKDAAVDKATAVKDVVVDKAIELKDATVETAQNAAETVSETVDEISYQARRFGSSAWTFTVANAVPLGLIGVGAGLLLSNQRKTRELPAPRPARIAARAVQREPRYPNPNDENEYALGVAYPAGGRSPVNARRGEKKSSELQDAPRKLEKLEEGVSHGAHVAYEETGRALETAKRKVSEGAARGRDVIKENWQRAQRVSSNLASDHPLALAFGTVLAGVSIGLLLPSTAREDELLKPSRDRFREVIGQARDAAEDVSQIARETANDTVASIEGNA